MSQKKVFSEEELMNYLVMMLIGLQYLEVNNVMHRDLKPDNILIDILPNGLEILLITDFGLSKNDEIH
jgi:serine/threonine protein kinase